MTFIMNRGYYGTSMSVRAVKEYELDNKPLSKFTGHDANKFNKFLNDFGCENVTVNELKILLSHHGRVADHHVGKTFRLVSFYGVNQLISHYSCYTSSLDDLEYLQKHIKETIQLGEKRISSLSPHQSGKLKYEYVVYNYDYILKTDSKTVVNSGSKRGIKLGNIIYEICTYAKHRIVVKDNVHITSSVNRKPREWNTEEVNKTKKYFKYDIRNGELN